MKDVAGDVLFKVSGIGCWSCFHGHCCCSKNYKLDYQSIQLGSVALSICFSLSTMGVSVGAESPECRVT